MLLRSYSKNSNKNSKFRGGLCPSLNLSVGANVPRPPVSAPAHCGAFFMKQFYMMWG